MRQISSTLSRFHHSTGTPKNGTNCTLHTIVVIRLTMQLILFCFCNTTTTFNTSTFTKRFVFIFAAVVGGSGGSSGSGVPTDVTFAAATAAAAAASSCPRAAAVSVRGAESDAAVGGVSHSAVPTIRDLGVSVGVCAAPPTKFRSVPPKIYEEGHRYNTAVGWLQCSNAFAPVLQLFSSCNGTMQLGTQVQGTAPRPASLAKFLPKATVARVGSVYPKSDFFGEPPTRHTLPSHALVPPSCPPPAFLCA